MKKRYKILAPILLLTFLSACGMSGPLYRVQPPQQKEVIQQVDTNNKTEQTNVIAGNTKVTKR
ncbi:hypothetical protein PCNPT3_00330 [Psychromonas sp. CNPT3]|uniref:LPS translocon maturation chaperone LptM n=1 Tax=Psychromonas sp. CNPT3 TaxID=314282 RepID=UPI00006E50B5|nr:lipoprotein [Psychromonas sp. CNPT3]AGH80008.1 hypothetical protein PCNPT3_00330 [Psychromonas sp. CNPT3]